MMMMMMMMMMMIIVRTGWTRIHDGPMQFLEGIWVSVSTSSGGWWTMPHSKDNHTNLSNSRPGDLFWHLNSQWVKSGWSRVSRFMKSNGLQSWVKQKCFFIMCSHVQSADWQALTALTNKGFDVSWSSESPAKMGGTSEQKTLLVSTPCTGFYSKCPFQPSVDHLIGMINDSRTPPLMCGLEWGLVLHSGAHMCHGIGHAKRNQTLSVAINWFTISKSFSNYRELTFSTYSNALTKCMYIYICIYMFYARIFHIQIKCIFN